MPARILIVEDDLESREMLTTVLQIEGFEVICAENGKEGFSVALEEKPDLIVTDLAMPSTDGVQLIRDLRGPPQSSRIPIIVLSAYRGAKVEEAIRAGANDALMKPVPLLTLITIIRELLAKSLPVALLFWAASGANVG